MPKGLNDLSREKLVALLEIMAKDLIALDGAWFQSMEAEQGMGVAMSSRARWQCRSEHGCRAVHSEKLRSQNLL